ncbi:MAG: site-2 protease family protein [Candidatus Nanoarchaeia archaeon]
MSFIVYDLIFLVLFFLIVGMFLYKHRNQGKREGIMFIFRTQFGVKAINWISGRYANVLHKIKYLVVGVGYLLMAAILYVLGLSLYRYISIPEITAVIKAPPIAPVIPYFPKLFGMESFFPPFYFTYFLVALAIVAICHEFSHGIFMRLFKMKIKSTGIVLLGPILGAFVEQDEKDFKKKKNFEQRVVLAAGTFTNLLLALIFFGLLVGFFFLTFQAGGYAYNTYSFIRVPINQIDEFGEQIGEKQIVMGNQIISLNLSEAIINNKTYFIPDNLKKQIIGEDLVESDLSVLLYQDSPALRKEIKGVLKEIDNKEITNEEDLRAFLMKSEPGEKIEIMTTYNEEKFSYELILDEHPSNKSKGFIGIGYLETGNEDLTSRFIRFFTSFKDSSTYYEPVWDGNFVIFIYNLIWWIMLINLLVALFNMLPLGILDGGRFFYLTILSLTKSKKLARYSFKFMTYLLLLVFILFMVFWFIRVF